MMLTSALVLSRLRLFRERARVRDGRFKSLLNDQRLTGFLKKSGRLLLHTTRRVEKLREESRAWGILIGTDK